MSRSVIQLKCDCNNYPWGKQGKESLAAVYASQTPGTDFKIDEQKEYAEMWMGTYPTTPSYVLSSNENLQDVLNANAEKLIGQPVLQKYGKDLPFLPKILSIQKALPLQIHPDKELASKLHQKNPDKFGDENHKPEIAVALSRFEVFVGWKPLQAIQSLFSSIPALQKRFVPEEQVHFNAETLQQIVFRILSASDDMIKDTQDDLQSLPREVFGKDAYMADLLPRLIEQYSKTDPGSLVALLCMNFLDLNPGDSVYVPADGIHAYLSGDIVECMARSDNVLNTGFCPRPDRDSIDLFTEALTFSPRSADEALLPAKPFDRGLKGKTKIYAPPMSEFNMLLTQLGAGESELVQEITGPSIMIVTSGSGTMKAEGETHKIEHGFIYFIGCCTSLEFEAEQGLEIYRAYCEA
ncbi:MAG: hypothetical protein M1837_005922 [Sclerophora amabilis]|nr:MAG: hypothetical protein M1837_005922 [Sclerophora amabilis]